MSLSGGAHGGGHNGSGSGASGNAQSANAASSDAGNSAEEANKEISLKFLFANQEGVHVILKFSKSTLVGQVKQQLMQNWPTTVATAPAPASIRLICMGRGLVDEKATLLSFKIPEYPMYPTPVNVFVSRKSEAVMEKETPAEPPPLKPAPSNASSCGCILS